MVLADEKEIAIQVNFSSSLLISFKARIVVLKPNYCYSIILKLMRFPPCQQNKPCILDLRKRER